MDALMHAQRYRLHADWARELRLSTRSGGVLVGYGFCWPAYHFLLRTDFDSMSMPALDLPSISYKTALSGIARCLAEIHV